MARLEKAENPGPYIQKLIATSGGGGAYFKIFRHVS